MGTLKIWMGSIWTRESLSECKQITFDEEPEYYCDLIVPHLCWLPPEDARRVAQKAFKRYLEENPAPVWAGYRSTYGELAPEPPPDAEIYSYNVYGRAVYLVPGDKPDPVYTWTEGVIWEPYYVAVELSD